MDVRTLSRIDLNLLVALQVLLEERNVSNAAKRMCITQSSMSNTLSRLRNVFDNQLLARSGGIMVPTPRAEQLAQKLPVILGSLKILIDDDEFSAGSYSGSFNIEIPEFISCWALPHLIQIMHSAAPNIQLHTNTNDDEQLQRLSSGQLDFIIQVEQQHYPEDFDVVTFGSASPVLLARKGHPLEGKELSWDMIEEYSQIRLTIPNVDNTHIIADINSPFIRHQARIRPHLETNQLFSALQVIRHSDHLLLGPPSFVEEYDLDSNLIALPFPEAEEFTLTYVVVSHRRTIDSKPHQFMREKLIETIEYYRSSHGMPTLEEMRK